MAITVRLGNKADNPKIQDLVTKITMPGPAEMCFQRTPDFFTGAAVIGEEFVITVADDDERPDVLAGLTVISGRDLYISGKRRRVFYSGDTRVDPFYRRRGIASQLFIAQKEFRTGQDLLQGIVLKDNTAPLDAARKAADGVLFDYWVSHTIETSFIYTRKLTPRIPAGVEIRAATAADVPAMQAFFDREAPRRNGYPCYDFSKMMAQDPYYAGISIGDYALAFKGGQIVGMLGGWNQKAFKQTRIVGMKPIMQVIRPLYNVYAGLFGGFKLPPVGGMLNYLTLHTTLVAGDDKAIYQGLIDWIMANAGQKYDALACAVCNDDPLLEVPRGYKRQKLFSTHFWLSYGDDPRPGIDNRPLYVELGRL
ncbi:hypothetical protein EYS42_13105 [Aquabacterium lacunae]|uniref:N-acetyltransferase domain-containing protein n=1 Tax=Aquabacterium lacunae TaxID=2528630 RepID=A0A4Q9GWD0_9BURK|nr:hypothetical protein [Aquabacterium lacunae]TBO29341.1 hypothetical protein EYS42_13105 [Aquabacterium lacunae]